MESHNLIKKDEIFKAGANLKDVTSYVISTNVIVLLYFLMKPDNETVTIVFAIICSFLYIASLLSIRNAGKYLQRSVEDVAKPD